MKRKTLRRLRLSPNEESQLIREEQDRRRKIRIQQVREQARTNALHIRTDVQRRREQELQVLAEELRQDWELQQREKIQALQRLYEESLRLLGQGHRSAKENEPDWEAMAQHAEENQVKAKQRYREALKELTSQRHKDQEEHNRPANARRKALQAERERAARVASLPPPPPHPIETIEENRPHAGRSNVSGFSATHHHCLEPTVDREVAATQPDAHEEAQQEARRLLEWRSEAERQREEQQEMARLRGRSALKREQLTQDRERLVVELEHMQQTELLRRRQQVAQMPAQIFQPLHRWREAREDGQRDMEFAFEDMYTGERRVKGDLVLKLVPEPLPAPSTTSSQELDVTVDDCEDTPLEVTPETEAGHHGNGQHPGPATERVEPPQPAHRKALRKLLDRIRTQRDKGWDHVVEPIRTESDQGRDHPQESNLISSAAACQPPVQPDEEPERDSSIDTGSLSVVEPGREASSPQLLPEPASVLETTGEESVLAPLPPEVLSSRMYEWKEREAELEREKRKQMALLEELEEQKSRLEGMLLHAQRQREDMQAAVDQEVSLQEREVPAHDQEANSDAPPPAASELEGSTVKVHISRIRQHQQRLLEQNRVHQRSVEVARQRLEQYQRALRLRHSTAIMHRAPTGPPAGLAPHPPLNLSAKTAVPVVIPPSVHCPTDCAVPPSALRKSPAQQSDAWRTPPPAHRPDLHPAPSLTRDPNRFPQDSPENNANGPPSAHRAGLSAWLTDSIMERATGHLPESLRSPPAAPNPFTHRPLRTAENVTTGVRQSSQLDTREPYLDTDPVRLLGQAAPQPGQASAKPQSFLRGHPMAETSLDPRNGDVESQRFELLEAHRRMQAQREEVEKQLRKQEEEQQRREEDRRSHEAQQRWEEERRREIEEGRRVEQQRHEEQRRLEEERWIREELQRKEEQKRHDEAQREQMRRQRDALQALINTETQVPGVLPVAEPLATGEEEDVGRSRLSLLSSLLRAIEESHGGSLSHLEEQPQPASCTPSPCANDPALLRVCLPSQSGGAAPPPRSQKPPLTRVKLGAMVIFPGQHELSAIQEVETPGERSLVGTGPEDILGSQTLGPVGAPGSWDRRQRPGALLTHAEERTVTSELSRRKRVLEQPPETEPSPSRPSWGPCEQPLAAVGSPGSWDRRQSPGALLTHVEERTVCIPLPASEQSTELSWRKRLLEQPPETVPGPSWGPCEQPLVAVGAPVSWDRHQSPGALLTQVEERTVCIPLPASELSRRKRLLEQPPETEPGPSRPSWGPCEQPLAAVGAPGSWDGHQSPGALLTQVEERSAVCIPASEQSTELSRRKRLPEQPPETEPGPPRPSWGPCEPGGRASGASVSPGSVGSGYTANSESAGRPAYPDSSFSSTSLSTGSYVTTDPEHNSAHTDVSEPHLGAELIQRVTPTDGSLTTASPPSALSSQGSCSVAPSSVGDSQGPSSSPGTSFSMGPRTSPGPETSTGSEMSPGRAVAALFHESSIQRIIDKYTRELNASLCSSADTTGSTIALEENQDPQSPAQVQTATPLTDTAPPRPGLEWDNAVNQILEQFSESVSLVQDISFRPLIGQLADQSSCLDTEGRPSAVAHLIGQPSAQSSMIGQLPGQSLRAGASRGAWDSTLSRMIDRLSHQPCSLWSSGGQDFYSSQLMGRLGLEQSSVVFNEAQEEGRMRPLIGQLDESGIQRPGSTGLCSSVDPTGSEVVQVQEDPPAPESPLHQPPGSHPPPHQPSSHWRSSGQDRYVSQLIGQPGLEASSLWLDDGQEEGRMKPLIGQLYDSAVQAAGSSGGSSSSLGSVESVLVAPPPPPASRDPVPVPESPHHQSAAPLCPHQPSSHQPSDGQLIRRLEFEQSSLWLDDGQEEGGMRPLIGQLDESGGQAAGSSGYGSYRTDQTRLNREHRDGTGGSAQAAVDPDLSAVPELEVLETRTRPPLQDPSDLQQQDPECSEGFADQDSFHPLLAQVTLNESLEPSLTFHLPQQEMPSSQEGSHQSTGREEAASTAADPPLSPHPSEEEDQGSLVDPSPEHPRAQEEEEPISSSSCLDSFCQLASSQSLLLESPEEVGEGDETDGCKQLVPVRDSTSKEPTNQLGFNLKRDAPIWDKIIGTAWEKGILEQSEITLVSLSDESMLGPDTTGTEDEEREVDSTLLPEEEDPPATQGSPQPQPGVVLEPQAGPGGGLQEAFQKKRLALIQRSALRVEEIRAKRVLAKTQPSQTQGKPPQLTQAKTQSVQNQPKTELIHSPTGPHLGQGRPEDHTRSKGQAPGQLVSSKTKEPQMKTMVVPVQTAVVPASRPDRKSKHPSPVSNAGMKGWEEVRTCTPSQKKLEGLEMHLRTRRLYGRLEEVKQQREVKSRQESYAQNRLKAKEFHQKTLQKLRAKQTAQ